MRVVAGRGHVGGALFFGPVLLRDALQGLQEGVAIFRAVRVVHLAFLDVVHLLDGFPVLAGRDIIARPLFLLGLLPTDLQFSLDRAALVAQLLGGLHPLLRQLAGLRIQLIALAADLLQPVHQLIGRHLVQIHPMSLLMFSSAAVQRF